MKKGVTFIMLAAALALAGCTKQAEPAEQTVPVITEAVKSTPEKSAESVLGSAEQEIKQPEPLQQTEGKKDRKYAADIKPMEIKTEREDVVFSASGGAYNSAFSLFLSCEMSTEIYYTTDGSNPANSDTALKYEDCIRIGNESAANVIAAIDPTLYCTAWSEFKNGELKCKISTPSDTDVDKCSVIRACAKLPDGTFGSVTSNTYFIGGTGSHIEGIKESCEAAGKPLAVLSITVDYDDLFDPETGIYVKGNIFEEAYKKYKALNPGASPDDFRKVDANYSQRGREWEKRVHLEMFEMDEVGATEVISTDCGIRVQGNYSRSDLQKGLRLYARSEYGDKKFKYDVFGKDAKDSEGNKIKKFDTLVLRAGGNTTFQAKYNDAFWQEAVKNMELSTQAARPCVVYINGEYFGLYVLEEDYSADYFESHYGVKSDNVVIYKGDAEEYERGWKLDEGPLPKNVQDDLFLKSLFLFFNNHSDLKNAADYEAFSKLVDVDSLRDYFVTEVWMNNKWDWPGKNWVIWRAATIDPENPYADGRWRFAMLDLDFGGVSGKGEAATNTVKEDNYKPLGLLDKDTSNPVVLMFAYLMTNEGFVKEYEKALQEIGETTFEPEKLHSLLDKYEGAYGPLFDQFFKRYPKTGSAKEALYGGYASSKCIREFVEARGGNIQKIISWIEKKKQ